MYIPPRIFNYKESKKNTFLFTVHIMASMIRLARQEKQCLHQEITCWQSWSRAGSNGSKNRRAGWRYHVESSYLFEKMKIKWLQKTRSVNRQTQNNFNKIRKKYWNSINFEWLNLTSLTYLTFAYNFWRGPRAKQILKFAINLTARITFLSQWSGPNKIKTMDNLTYQPA